ncbi:rod shape-determining protein RodA, partial [Bacillus nitratireducens]|nr:rod shape-determining protein RodA [Bacillus nitratireducens]
MRDNIHYYNELYNGISTFKDLHSQYQISYVLLFILFAIGIVSCCAIAIAHASLPPFLQNVNFV